MAAVRRSPTPRPTRVTTRRCSRSMRKGRPDASCLVVSPTDQAEAKDGEYPSRPVMPVLVEAQKKAAQAAGLCVLLDLCVDGRQGLGGEVVQEGPRRFRLPAPVEERRRQARQQAVFDALMDGHEEVCDHRNRLALSAAVLLRPRRLGRSAATANANRSRHAAEAAGCDRARTIRARRRRAIRWWSRRERISRRPGRHARWLVRSPRDRRSRRAERPRRYRVLRRLAHRRRFADVAAAPRRGSNASAMPGAGSSPPATRRRATITSAT